jgi:hypothetical protein
MHLRCPLPSPVSATPIWRRDAADADLAELSVVYEAYGARVADPT